MALPFRKRKQKRLNLESFEGKQIQKAFPGFDGLFTGTCGPLNELRGARGGKNALG